MQKIEDDRFANQYANIQSQLEEELKLQSLREDAQKKELDYMVSRLKHAEDMYNAELAAWNAISGFIDAVYNNINGGGSNNSGSSAGGNGSSGTVGNGVNGTPPEDARSLEQPVSSNMSSGQPVVVEIMMDTQKVGEILLTPDRLRRGTKVLLEREKWR